MEVPNLKQLFKLKHLILSKDQFSVGHPNVKFPLLQVTLKNLGHFFKGCVSVFNRCKSNEHSNSLVFTGSSIKKKHFDHLT